MSNTYDLCTCGLRKQKRSPCCRKCFLSRKDNFSHLIRFKKGYTPWNKGFKGKYHWSPETRDKIMSFVKANGGGMKGKKHTLESRRATSEKLSGSKAPNWQGGITPLNHRRRHSVGHWEWREFVFKRDDWTCQVCLSRGRRLAPHHIRPWRSYKALQFDVNNGVTLCYDCHKLTINREEKFIQFFLKILIMGTLKNRVNSGNLLEEMKTILRQS